MNIDNLTFEDKVNLLKLLVDDLDITLTAHYGATGYFCSNDVSIIEDEKVEIWTNINTG